MVPTETEMELFVPLVMRQIWCWWKPNLPFARAAIQAVLRWSLPQTRAERIVSEAQPRGARTQRLT
jgi:hypothetical protein